MQKEDYVRQKEMRECGMQLPSGRSIEILQSALRGNRQEDRDHVHLRPPGVHGRRLNWPEKVAGRGSAAASHASSLFCSNRAQSIADDTRTLSALGWWGTRDCRA